MIHGRILSTIESRNLLAEEQLMIAVLEQAFADLESDCAAVRADAEAYFLAYDGSASIFGLDAVCTQFQICPSAVRSLVRRNLREHGPRRGKAALAHAA